MEDFKEIFVAQNYYWKGSQIVAKIDDLAKDWKDEKNMKPYFDFSFIYEMNGFIKAGIDAFNISNHLSYKIDTYWYGFTLVNFNNQQPFFKKLYGEQLTKEDIEFITETIYSKILDDIEGQLKYTNLNNE